VPYGRRVPGGRTISGRDVRAAARHLGGRGVDVAAVEAAVEADAEFRDLAELARALPPARVGLTPGAFAALFSPLFGEFE
jgi:hypothetical protein